MVSLPVICTKPQAAARLDAIRGEIKFNTVNKEENVKKIYIYIKRKKINEHYRRRVSLLSCLWLLFPLIAVSCNIDAIHIVI